MKKSLYRGNSYRPVSWCIGGVCPLTKSKCFLTDDDDNQFDSNARHTSEPGYHIRGGLVRSTSYQALHSALARLYRLDDFALERIGQGFFSEVFKARHLVTGKLMVLKMNKLFSNRHNMLREVELMNRLHHPNILTYYGVCVHEGQVHALTQYINGGSLDVLLQNRRIELSWLTKISLALDIAKGMAYLHSRRVFHRDLTSKNILIKHTKENGRHRLRAVIADFGLAAPITQDGSVRLRQVGSPYWMAPEVIRGDWYDHRVDVFSFGIIACEIIARCDADPDILPRTHNFGVHYLAFSRMCQSDCPPSFLEIAFQCCQIDPDSRPSFSELENMLRYLITEYRLIKNPSVRKGKAYHKRSLSDESCSITRMTSASEANSTCLLSTNNSAPSTNPIGTPQEVLERLSATDPYFQPTTATVNPFNQVKLPAKSQLIVQEGGRYCHSMPDLRTCHFKASVSLSPSSHMCSLDPSCPESSSVSPCIGSNNVNGVCDECSDSPCSCILNQSCKKRITDKSENDYKCQSVTGKKPSSNGFKLFSGNWIRDSYPAPNISEVENASGTSPRSDAGGGHNTNNNGALFVRRRGSGESGFFSVEDVERIGTPELCLSFSELSTTSVVSAEEEEGGFGHQLVVHRSPSIVTDSSEDLSSLGCCQDQNCDLASLPDCDQPGSHVFNSEYSTDIKSIVEFFERGYGSLRSSSETERNRKLAVSSRRKDCLVPILRSRFNSAAFHRPFVCATSFSKQPLSAGITQGSISPKLLCAKDNSGNPPQGYNFPQKLEKKDTFKIRERPKVYITEGTVRAKRNIFESKND